jgi:anti-sigma B factor antagonist
MSAAAAQVVVLSGDVDVQARVTTRARLAEVSEAGRAIVDLTAAEYIDSSGVTELLLAHQRRDAGGAEPIRLVIAPGSNVGRLIALAGLDQVFTVFSTVESARNE